MSMENRPEYQMLKSIDEVKAMFASFKGADAVSFDTETTISRPLSRKLVGMSFAVADCENPAMYYIPVGHVPRKQGGLFDGVEENLDPKEVVEELRKFVHVFKGRVFIHNAVFDLFMCWLYKLSHREWKSLYTDTMIAVAVMGAKWTKGLDKQVESRYGYEMMSLKDMMARYKVRQPSEIPAKVMMPYACDDAWFTLRLGYDVVAELKAKRLWKVFWDLEMQTLPAVLEMLQEGICLDVDMLNEMDRVCRLKIRRIENEWMEMFPGVPIGSPQKLSKHMFDGRDPLWNPAGLVRGKNGAYPTKASVIEAQVTGARTEEGREAAKLLLEHRGLKKMQSTYTGTLALQADPDGRIRPSQNQVGTGTGRFSSSNPNCQNIPRVSRAKWPDEPGSLPHIRAAFRARPGWMLIDTDYSQVELRMMAHLSKDKVMLDVYRQKCTCIGGGMWEPSDKYVMVLGKPDCAICKGTGFSGDIHQSTADATRSTRQEAKPQNFGLIYGMSPKTLAGAIGCSWEKAKRFHAKYFETYAGVRLWHKKAVSSARRTGYVKTITGRIRYIPDIMSEDWQRRGPAERQVWNTACQGGAADLIKIALRNLYVRWRDDKVLGTHCKMMLMVHDELICEVREELVEEQCLVIKETMESVANLAVPLLAAPDVADNWAEAH
jgi:DNA polymerase-1